MLTLKKDGFQKVFWEKKKAALLYVRNYMQG